MTSKIADAANRGFAKASLYDAHRPSYPLDFVEALLQHLHVAGVQGVTVVDLAAGTGKFTEILASRPEGYRIIAVEPQDDMRAELERKKLPGVEVVKGEADNMPVDDGGADAVVVAQAFHWFANEAALNEIYRVLIPGGSLGMIWNTEDYNAPKSWTPTTEWEATLKDIVWATGNENPRLRHEQWKKVFDNQIESNPVSIHAADPRFSLPIGEEAYPWTHWLTEEELFRRFSTLSHLAVLEGDDAKALKDKVYEALAESSVERNEHGKIALHGKSTSAWTTAIPGAPLKSGG